MINRTTETASGSGEDGISFPLEQRLQQLPSPQSSKQTYVVRSDYDIFARVKELGEEIARLTQERDQYQKDSITDALTGVFNRGYFDAYFAQLKANSERNGTPYTVLMVDIDNFKKVNDRWGHGVGDRTLKQVAQTLELNVRTGDCVTRYGGEEFAVVLYGADPKDIFSKIETLRKSVYDTVKTPDGKPVSISIGASDSCSRSDTLHTADQLLYAAKRAGRNKTRAFVGNVLYYTEKKAEAA
jgi:diguanylate cyclase (GGDEF)-like protein